MNLAEARAVAERLKSECSLTVEAYLPVDNSLDNAKLRISMGNIHVDYLNPETADWHTYAMFINSICKAIALAERRGQEQALERIYNNLESLVKGLQ